MKKTASGILPMIALDRESPKALHTQIYDAFRLAIVGGKSSRAAAGQSPRSFLQAEANEAV